MVKDIRALEKFEQEILLKQQSSLFQAFRIVDGLWDLAKTLKVIPLADPLEGIEVDIQIAKILNSHV